MVIRANMVHYPLSQVMLVTKIRNVSQSQEVPINSCSGRVPDGLGYISNSVLVCLLVFFCIALN